MHYWVDDIRLPPHEAWLWWKTSAEAIKGFEAIKRMHEKHPLYKNKVIVSLDHDLGGDDTSRPIVLWFCENDWWPDEVYVHSANPPGVYWLESMIERYHPSNAHKYTR